MKHLLTPLKPLALMALFVFSQASFASVQEGLVWTQQGEWWEAEPLFLAEAEKGNPEAMFWLAKTQMRMGGERIFTLGHWMEQSAELGNPWAMIELVDGPNTYCSFFMLPCDDKWFDKAIEKWQALAANGDGKAMFMLAKHKDTWRKYVPYLAHRTRVAQYEQSLEMGANQAAIALSSELRNHQDIKDPAVIKQALSYLKIAADRGYAPAMTEFYNFYESIGMDKVEPFLKQATELGYADAAFLLVATYEEKEQKKQADWKTIYKYTMLARKLDPSGQRNALDYIDFDEKLPSAVITLLDREVADFLTKVQPNRFYDETNLY